MGSFLLLGPVMDLPGPTIDYQWFDRFVVTDLAPGMKQRNMGRLRRRQPRSDVGLSRCRT